MTEFRSLLGLRWRLARASIMYWLAVLGYEPGGAFLEQIYRLYILLVILGLVAITWSEALSGADQVGLAMRHAPNLQSDLILALPALVTWVTVVLMAVAATSSPLKLTSPDLAYVASSPTPRPVIAGVAMLGAAVPRFIVLALGASLVSVVLTASVRADVTAALAVLPITALAIALLWLVGLLRLASPRLRRRRSFLWPLPLVLLPLSNAVPAVGFFPGRVFTDTLAGTASTAEVLGLVCLALAVAAAALVSARRVSLTDVSDESALFARLQTIPKTFLIMDRGVRAAALGEVTGRARRTVVRLPHVEGPRLLAAASGLAIARRPSRLFDLWRDGAVSIGGLYVLLMPNSPEPWLIWLLYAAFFPPRTLAGRFTGGVEQPFLSQFLPPSDLRLLVADVALPGGLVALVTIVWWLIAAPSLQSAVLGILFGPALLALRIGCATVIARRPLSVRGKPLHVPFFALGGVSFAIVGLIATAAKSPSLALLVAVVICIIFSFVLNPPRPPAPPTASEEA